METFHIILLAILAIIGFALWFDLRAKNHAQRIKSELDVKVDSIRKTLDGTLTRVMRLEDAVKHPQEENHIEDKEVMKKPVTIDSVLTAIRINGYKPSADNPDANGRQVVYFTANEINFRADTTNLPFLSIAAVYGVNETKERLDLLENAASQITSCMYIGKAFLTENADGVIFSTEMICDSYVHLRDNLKHYLAIINDTKNHFFDTYSSLKEKREAEMKALLSGNDFSQSTASKSKVQS